MGKINLSKLQTMAPQSTNNNVTDNKTKEDSTMAANNTNATANNNTAKETTMNREIRTGKKTEGQFTVDYQKNGYGAIIPIIDGVEHPELMMGYVSEADAQAGLKLLEEALKATNGDIPAAMRYMYTAASVAAADIKPTETVEIPELDAEFLIDYEKKAIYYYDDEKANLDDLDTTNWPNEAIKAMLVTRAKEKWEQEEEGANNLIDLLAGLM